MKEEKIIGFAILAMLFGGLFYVLGYFSGIKAMNSTSTVVPVGVINMTCSIYPSENAMCCSPIEVVNGRAWAYKSPSGFNMTYLCQYNLTSAKFINCTRIL